MQEIVTKIEDIPTLKLKRVVHCKISESGEHVQYQLYDYVAVRNYQVVNSDAQGSLYVAKSCKCPTDQPPTKIIKYHTNFRYSALKQYITCYSDRLAYEAYIKKYKTSFHDSI
jgi:hypothetical protein